ncbi:hypothetical protein AB0L50_36570 [Streptomyces flaveolus]|uniref:hypothetical protein n=1 Tax=Streptomyces flaveolus TaxID=67297 RepID=UPI003426C824
MAFRPPTFPRPALTKAPAPTAPPPNPHRRPAPATPVARPCRRATALRGPMARQFALAAATGAADALTTALLHLLHLTSF